jgi:Uma2 family endonuclease
MGEVGIFGEDDRVELIDGEVVEMNPVGGPHISCVVGLTHLLIQASGGRYFVSVQNPIRLRDGREPLPDLSLLKRRPVAAEGPPASGNLLLVVEVSDTTLAYDRDFKLPLYAEDGIREAWIVDLNGRRVEVHSDPGAGGYRSIRISGPGESVASATVEGLLLPVDEVLA